jgi:class 3 adenylate cyclase
MALATWLTYRQQENSLRDEVVKRGATIARSLASSAAEAVLNDLVCAALIHETMPDESVGYPQINLAAVMRSLWNDIIGPANNAYSDIPRNTGVVEVLMVDTNNIIVAHNDIQKVAQIYEPPKGIQPYESGPILVQPYTMSNGEKRFDIAVPILVNRLGTVGGGKLIGVVHLGMSQTLVEQTVKQAAFKLLLVTSVLLLLGMISALLLANFLVEPIKRLVTGTLAIANGDLNQELQVVRNDELGDLTTAFNAMAASLREKELIKGAFTTYVSSQVMEEVLRDPGRMALGGARKIVSIFFSDIRGFTSMSESMQPEEVVSVINAYLSLQTEIILKNGGMLDKFIGDCVMAVFGTPIARPDDALRAVRSAIEVQEAVRRLNQRRKELGEKTVEIGIGINTGVVVSGNMGSSQKMDYTVIGDAVNLAARLEAVAEGGSIYLSEATYKEVRPVIAAEKLKPLDIKGKKDQVQVYCIRPVRSSDAAHA